MKCRTPAIQPFGERALLISWEEKIDDELLRLLLSCKKRIQENRDGSIVEVHHTYNALAVVYSTAIKNVSAEISSLKSLISAPVFPEDIVRRMFRIPVCYDLKFGLDLEALSIENNLSIQEVISLHTKPEYTIYFMGFLPGFLYLGGLDKSLYSDRRAQPRKRIEKGAVGIGGKQTGIYPSASPGGWQIIGNCPLDIFDANQNPPCIFQAGDHIRFYSISPEEHAAILKQVKQGQFSLKPEIHD